MRNLSVVDNIEIIRKFFLLHIPISMCTYKKTFNISSHFLSPGIPDTTGLSHSPFT